MLRERCKACLQELRDPESEECSAQGIHMAKRKRMKYEHVKIEEVKQTEIHTGQLICGI